MKNMIKKIIKRGVLLITFSCFLVCQLPAQAEEDFIPKNNIEVETVSGNVPDVSANQEEIPALQTEDPAIDGTFEPEYRPGDYIIRPMIQFMNLMLRKTSAGSIKPVEGTSRDFQYTNSVERYTAPIDGIYKIEAWGAQGGGERSIDGGLGGYAVGYLKMAKYESVYFCVGSAGYDENGGYNGGGSGLHGPWDGGWRNTGAGGGGCTSVTRTGRGALSSFDLYRNEVLLVAGGGGGDHHSEAAAFFKHEKNHSEGTEAGGLKTDGILAICRYSKDDEDSRIYKSAVRPVGQNYGYQFGIGESNGKDNGAGGGGWFGGYAADLGNHVLSGGGGSSYISGVPEIHYGSSVYPATTENAVNIENGRARITLHKILLQVEMKEDSAEVIEKQTAEISADVYGIGAYEWEVQKTEPGQSPKEDNWAALKPEEEHYEMKSYLNQGTGEISLKIKTDIRDHETWYRLKVTYDFMEKISEPCKLIVNPLKMDYLECKTALTAEAGDWIEKDSFQVTAVYNNPGIRTNIWENPWEQKHLFFRTNKELTEKLCVRTVGEKIPLTLHLEHSDQPKDAAVFIRVTDTKAPVIKEVTLEHLQYAAQDQQQEIEIHVTAEDESDGLLFYWVTSESAEISTDIKTNPVISVSFQHNEVIIIHVRDEMGNESVREVLVNYVDKNAPDPVRIEADQTEWTSEKVRITVFAEDQLSGLGETPYSFDGGKTWQKEPFLDVLENNNLDINVRDVVGNITETAYEVSNIDHTPPIIEAVNCKPESNWTQGDAAVTVIARDEGCGLAQEAYSFDGGMTWQSSPDLILQNSSLLKIWVRDKLGQSAEAEYQIQKINRITEIWLDITDQKQNVLVEVSRQPNAQCEEGRTWKQETRTKEIRYPLIKTENTFFENSNRYQNETGDNRILKKDQASETIIISKNEKDPETLKVVLGAASAAGGTAGMIGFGFFLIFRCCEIYKVNREEGREEYYRRKILHKRKEGYLVRFGKRPEKMEENLYRVHFSKHFLKKNAGKTLVISFQDREYELIIGRTNKGCNHILKL